MSTEVESLELKIKSNSTDAVNGIDALTQSLSRLKSATKGLGLSGVATGIGQVADATKKAASSNAVATKSFTDLFYKVKTGAGTFKLLGQKIWSAIEKSNDYTENVNLFTVSMGEYAGEAMEYAETVSDAMGIDTSEWIRAQGVFMTLATGFGVAGDRAATMSKNLTQLGYDLSSFYNKDVETMMQKLKSGLAGELEPLRSIGYDLSQAKLEATAVELGITKSVSAMTQAEKAQLRYYAIMTQVTHVQGDMARTLDDPANQLRVLKAEVNMAAREIGNVFIPALNAVLPYAIAVTKVIGMLAKTIAGLFGYEMQETKSATSEVVTNTDAIADNFGDAQAEAKKLKSYILGFDELNVINPNEGSSDAADGLGEFEFELPEYDFMDGLVESKVNDIVEDMKEWLGITDDIDTWAELFETRLGNILVTVGLIGAGFAAWKIGTEIVLAVKTIAGLVESIGKVVAIGGKFLGWLGAFISLVKEGGFVAAFSVAFPKLSAAIAAVAPVALPVIAIIAGLVSFIVGLVDAIKDGITWLDTLAITLGAVATGAAIGFLVGGPIGAGIGALIGLAIGLVTDFTIWFWQKFDEIEAWFNGLPGWGKAIFIALASVVSACVGPIFTVIAGIVTLIKKWDEIPGWVSDNVIKPVGAFFKGLWKSVSGFFKNLWEDISGVWKSVSTWFETNVIDPVSSFFEGVTLRIGQFFEGCWIIIQAVWLLASTWFDETVIQPTVAFFKGLWETVSGYFAELWKDISVVWKAVSTWFNDTVVKPVVEFFKGVWTDVSGYFKSLWEDVSLVWGAVSTWFNDTIIEPVKTAFETACTAIGGFFSSLWLNIRRGVAGAMNGVIGGIESAINWVVGGINKLIGGFNDVVQWAADIIGEDWGGVTLLQEVKFSRIAVPTYAEGGFPEQGQMFIAREAGAEMVGNIGRRTAVANNDQIVAGIAGGVAEANEEQNALLREQNSLLRALLDKDSGVYLDGKNLTNSVEKYQRERGRVLIAGGVL